MWLPLNVYFILTFIFSNTYIISYPSFIPLIFMEQFFLFIHLNLPLPPPFPSPPSTLFLLSFPECRHYWKPFIFNWIFESICFCNLYILILFSGCTFSSKTYSNLLNTFQTLFFFVCVFFSSHFLLQVEKLENLLSSNTPPSDKAHL